MVVSISQLKLWDGGFPALLKEFLANQELQPGTFPKPGCGSLDDSGRSQLRNSV